MDTIDSITIIAAAWGLLVLRLTLAFILWPHGTPVSYTHLTLPTILRV